MEEDISELLAQKEKELKELSKLRLVQLEDQLRSKNKQIEDLNQKLLLIQEDFNYNVKLIDDRDAELTELEEKYNGLRNVIKQKDAEISELRACLAATEQKIKNESSKQRTQEIILSETRDQLREELAELKWRKEDEIRKLNKALEENQNNFDKALREKEHEMTEFKMIMDKKYSREIEEKYDRFEEEKRLLLSEIEGKNGRIEVLNRDRQDLQGKLEQILAENKVVELEKAYADESKKNESLLYEKELQITKLIDHAKHLSQQNDQLKSQLESETEYANEQKIFYEKELNKFKNSHQQDINFIKESYEIQIQRLNSTFSSQVTRLQQRLQQSEEDSEKAYTQAQQLREKILQSDRKTSHEISKIEDGYKNDIKNAEEMVRLLKLELSGKDTEMKGLQENLGSWKARAEQYSEESKNLRLAIQEADVAIQALKGEVFQSKQEKTNLSEGVLEKIREGYEKRIKGLMDELELARNKGNVRNKEKALRGFEEFPKLWSEDLGPASSIRSSESQKTLAQENEELKKIIENMRIDMEIISQNAQNIPDDYMRNKELLQRMKGELVRVSAERDQLLEISSELRAELRMYNNSKQEYQEKDIYGQLTSVQEDFKRSGQGFNPNPQEEIMNFRQPSPLKATKNLPKYEDFQEILFEKPEKEDQPLQKKPVIPPVNSLRETASQKEVSERYRANLKKTKKPIARNYNTKD